MAKAMDDLMQWITTPEWAKDTVFVDIDIVLDWKDILLLIWRRGRMGLRVKTYVENGPVGKAESKTRVIIRRLVFPWTPKVFGYMDARTIPDPEHQP